MIASVIDDQDSRVPGVKDLSESNGFWLTP